MRITLTATTGNAAFVESEDIRAVLHKAVDSLIDNHILYSPILDYNGNTVGNWKKSFPKKRRHS